ncbi:peptidoglycan DD-metalloendopeptidase family protein [Mumia flava]|uniref:peptidoglycan DD-metalloendopeptidase family protein n=1 Tax=Mumia flava TaxID=1348852 RepID=UPI001476D082|nr:peptidoglycan DD-metalloendopeptidase family protein [Mumia flava]
MTRTRALLLLALALTVAALPASGSAAYAAWDWPVDGGEVAAGYLPPTSPYGPGHRGLDVAAPTGSVVRAVAAGTVTFAGRVAGVGAVTVDHGGRRSTYQPVVAVVRSGAEVSRGEPLGRLSPVGSHCGPRACLHLGRIEADGYADPLALLSPQAQVRLFPPHGPAPVPPEPERVVPSGDLLMPVDAPVTSRFGMRVHPVTGVHKLHDGTDFGASCGTPVRAADAGTVSSVGSVPGYGNRVRIEHGGATATTYNHLASFAVGAGEPVAQGQTVGAVGSTGLSTGCHLHLSVLLGGQPVDPEPLLTAP